MSDGYLTLEEIAHFLSVSEEEIVSWMNNGTITSDAFFEIGETLRFSREKTIQCLHENSLNDRQNHDTENMSCDADRYLELREDFIDRLKEFHTYHILVHDFICRISESFRVDGELHQFLEGFSNERQHFDHEIEQLNAKFDELKIRFSGGVQHHFMEFEEELRYFITLTTAVMHEIPQYIEVRAKITDYFDHIDQNLSFPHPAPCQLDNESIDFATLQKERFFKDDLASVTQDVLPLSWGWENSTPLWATTGVNAYFPKEDIHQTFLQEVRVTEITSKWVKVASSDYDGGLIPRFRLTDQKGKLKVKIGDTFIALILQTADK